MENYNYGDNHTRAWGSIGYLCVIAVAAAALPLIAEVKVALNVGVLELAIAMGVTVVAMVGTTAVYHVAPRWFAKAEIAEQLAIQLALAYLIMASGKGDSLFWVFLATHTILNSLEARHALIWRMFVGPPLLVVGFFAARQQWGAAAISAIITAIDLYFLKVGQAISQDIFQRAEENRKLTDALANLRIEHERQRISRDIHDGIGADLAAMEWRLRNLADETHGGPLAEDIGELRARLAGTISDLQAVAWALRSQTHTWGELQRYLRQRAIELAGRDFAVDVVATENVQEIYGERSLEFARCVLEAVRNAVRHSGGNQLRVVLDIDATWMRAMVGDNGKGITEAELAAASGGVLNLRARTHKSGGTVRFERGANGGTQVTIALPHIVPPGAAPGASPGVLSGHAADTPAAVATPLAN